MSGDSSPDGVTTAFLTGFLQDLKKKHSDHDSLTTKEVCERVVLPEIKAQNAPYVEAIRQKDPKAVGAATMHVVHAWDNKIVPLLETLIEFGSANADTVFWLDLFCINHPNTDNLSKKWWTKTYTDMIADRGQMMLVLSPWDDHAPFQNAQCLWDIYSGMHERKVRLFVHLSKAQEAAFKEAMLKDAEHVTDTLRSVESHKCAAATTTQTDLLRTAIKDNIGFASLDAKIKHMLSGWCLEHASDYVDELKAQGKNETVAYGQLGAQVGVLLWEFDQHEPGMEYFQTALQVCSQFMGQEDRTLASVFRRLGVCLLQVGEVDTAINCFERVLQITHATVGEMHTDTADMFKIVGDTMRARGAQEGAIKYHSKALEIRLHVLGEDHDDTRESRRDVAQAYESKGDYTTALEHLNKALEVMEGKEYGPYDTTLAAVYNQLGRVYARTKQNDEAIRYAEKALEMFEKAYGEDHPESASSINVLAQVYQNKGDTTRAIEYLHRALEVDMITVGMNHPSTGLTFRNLGVAYAAKEDYEQGIEYCQTCVNILTDTLGRNHPQTRMAQQHLQAVRQQRDGKQGGRGGGGGGMTMSDLLLLGLLAGMSGGESGGSGEQETSDANDDGSGKGGEEAGDGGDATGAGQEPGTAGTQARSGAEAAPKEEVNLNPESNPNTTTENITRRASRAAKYASMRRRKSTAWAGDSDEKTNDGEDAMPASTQASEATMAAGATKVTETNFADNSDKKGDKEARRDSSSVPVHKSCCAIL